MKAVDIQKSEIAIDQQLGELGHMAKSALQISGKQSYILAQVQSLTQERKLVKKSNQEHIEILVKGEHHPHLDDDTSVKSQDIDRAIQDSRVYLKALLEKKPTESALLHIMNAIKGVQFHMSVCLYKPKEEGKID